MTHNQQEVMIKKGIETSKFVKQAMLGWQDAQIVPWLNYQTAYSVFWTEIFISNPKANIQLELVFQNTNSRRTLGWKNAVGGPRKHSEKSSNLNFFPAHQRKLWYWG